jgi:hypothetical protein
MGEGVGTRGGRKCYAALAACGFFTRGLVPMFAPGLRPMLVCGQHDKRKAEGYDPDHKTIIGESLEDR